MKKRRLIITGLSLLLLLWIFQSNKNMDFLKNLFGSKDQVTTEEMVQLVNNGSPIIDVRTPQEFQEGHIENSINIPLQELDQHLDELREKQQPIITVCRSGNRSGQATNLLNQNQIPTHNGGAWTTFNKALHE